jgi:ABC-2 type transport system ATP-binding protein
MGVTGMQFAVEIENLSKEYETGFLRKKRVLALDNLTLNVERGEVFGLLGANGAGKTTTLKLLLGLTFPTSGSARILGRQISDVRMHSQISYLPEQPYFYEYLSARELLEYFGKIFGFSHKDSRHRAEKFLRAVRLEEKAWDRQIRQYSKGMKQRVGLAQALINDPEVVFLDEPMSGLDPIGRREVRDLIAELKSNGVTVIFCTHILSDIEILCDRVAILKSGRLSHTGRLIDLCRSKEGSAVEMQVAGIASGLLDGILPKNVTISVTTAPGGASIKINSEKDVESVLGALRPYGAQLVSIQPVRSSLEDLLI